jgi:hypothetical protein
MYDCMSGGYLSATAVGTGNLEHHDETHDSSHYRHRRHHYLSKPLDAIQPGATALIRT